MERPADIEGESDEEEQEKIFVLPDVCPEEEWEECQCEHASEYPGAIREKRHTDSAWEYLRDKEEEEEGEREESSFGRNEVAVPGGFLDEWKGGEEKEECRTDIEEIVFGDAEEIAPSHRVSVDIDVFLREEEVRMDVGKVSREYVPDVERVLADMREVGEYDDGEEEDGERVPPREMEDGGMERDDGRYEPGDERDDERFMEEISEEDGGSGEEEKESIRREFGMDGDGDDEEGEHAGERLRNGFREEDDDDPAREREEERDRLLERMTEIARYERGRENEQGREEWEEILEKCVEVDMCGDAEKIGEGKEEWSRFGKCRHSSLREIFPRLRDPVVGIEIGKGVIGGDHIPHDSYVKECSCAEKFQGEYLLIVFRNIEWRVFASVPSEKYRGREEDESRVDEWERREKDLEILMFDDEKESGDDE